MYGACGVIDRMHIKIFLTTLKSENNTQNELCHANKN
jgi:hypothetical protein